MASDLTEPTTEREPDDTTLPEAVSAPTRNKGGRPSTLTPEVIKSVSTRVFGGAYVWVACAAEGIGPTTFYRWMQKGKKESEAVEDREEAGEVVEVSLHAQFYREVQRARAKARYAAESAVKKDNPLAWLRYGPGRDRPGEEGWTESNKVELTGKNGTPLHPSGPVVDPAKLSDVELDLLEKLLTKGAPDGLAGDS
jgi:hypothetical protein